MPLLRCLLIAAAIGQLGVWAQTALAQGAAGGRYPMRSPVLSPWLQLFQRNAGPLDNYHTFVRPQMELLGTLQRQGIRLQQQGAGILRLDDELSQWENRRMSRPTGTGSVFMDYSHYYDLRSPTERFGRPTVRSPALGTPPNPR